MCKNLFFLFFSSRTVPRWSIEKKKKFSFTCLRDQFDEFSRNSLSLFYTVPDLWLYKTKRKKENGSDEKQVGQSRASVQPQAVDGWRKKNSAKPSRFNEPRTVPCLCGHKPRDGQDWEASSSMYRTHDRATGWLKSQKRHDMIAAESPCTPCDD